MITKSSVVSLEEAKGGRIRVQRISASLPEPLYEELKTWADERGESVSGVLRWSLGVAKVIWDQMEQDQRIFAGSSSERPERELIFSRYI